MEAVAQHCYDRTQFQVKRYYMLYYIKRKTMKNRCGESFVSF